MIYEVKTRIVHNTSGLFSQGGITNQPCPAITIGINGLNSIHYQVEYYLTNTPPLDIMTNKNQNKPPYKVPLMAEIESITWNGFNAISTFSGCGGSCLGYRMAGFKVLWSSEFIPAAQEVYRLNHPHSILDTRDIRKVRPEEILEAIGLKVGELDLMDGSPPCASFSTAGKREKGWGQVKNYSDTRQRVDDLFFEYTRILKGLQPKVFVAENVSGLVKGKAKGYFLDILKELKSCGYNVRSQLLDAQWLGVPQMRQRIIFIGVRNDLGLGPVFPKPLPYRYSVREAIPWIINIRHGKGFGEEEWTDAQSAVSQTVGTQPSSGNNFNNGAYKVEIGIIRQGNKNGHSSQRSEIVNFATPSPMIIAGDGSGQFEVETHYVEPETDISRYAIGQEYDKLGPGEKSKVTQRGGDNTVASVTHPTEKRKFTIAELKRICAFPDDFQLVGSYAQQWERLGRAVPPVMMEKVAIEIRDHILKKL